MERDLKQELFVANRVYTIAKGRQSGVNRHAPSDVGPSSNLPSLASGVAWRRSLLL